MEETRTWLEDWNVYIREPTDDNRERLLHPIQSNDTVLNEILAKELVNNHLVDFCFHLLSPLVNVRQTVISILTSLSQSSSPYCRRLSAMCVMFILFLEWISAEPEENKNLAKCLETIFSRQEQAIHPMPPTVRIPAIETNPPREITLLSQYYSMGPQDNNKCSFTAVSRLAFTLRLCLLFVDFASDAPKECILVYNICWILFLGCSVPSFKLSESVLAEISDILTPQQARDLSSLLQNELKKEYTAINEDILVMLLEWIPFAMERCPASTKALYTLVSNRAKSEGYPAALLILMS